MVVVLTTTYMRKQNSMSHLLSDDLTLIMYSAVSVTNISGGIISEAIIPKYSTSTISNLKHTVYITDGMSNAIKLLHGRINEILGGFISP